MCQFNRMVSEVALGNPVKSLSWYWPASHLIAITVLRCYQNYFLGFYYTGFRFSHEFMNLISTLYDG